MAFAEYARASGDDECLDIALKTYKRIQMRKGNPKGKYNKVITKNRKMKNLSLPMINLNITTILKSIKPKQQYDDIIGETIKEVMTHFVDTRNRVIRENITPDGKYIDDTYEGRHINPGHGIEAMWFIMSAANERKDRKTVRKACEAVKWLLNFGWDKEYEGIFYFMDVYGKSHIELCWDMKLEWVHVETLIALLMGYTMTGDKELLKWFEKVHTYTWSRFPDKKYGEWYKYLNRQGEVNNRCKSNKWQNFFHLPRALYMISEMCKNL
jgi:N-acylglucosamine 2-epimerase